MSVGCRRIIELATDIVAECYELGPVPVADGGDATGWNPVIWRCHCGERFEGPVYHCHCGDHIYLPARPDGRWETFTESESLFED